MWKMLWDVNFPFYQKFVNGTKTWNQKCNKNRIRCLTIVSDFLSAVTLFFRLATRHGKLRLRLDVYRACDLNILITCGLKSDLAALFLTYYIIKSKSSVF